MLKLRTFLIIHALLLLFAARPSFQQNEGDGSVCKRDMSATNTITRLRKKLFCFGYDVNRPAYFGNETVEISLGLRVHQFHFDDKTDSLEVHSWLRVGWFDFRLKWDPANFDNIDKIRLVSYYLWKPDLGDYTAADMNKITMFIRPSMCVVYSDGYVICVPPYTHTAFCSADLTLWPYDSHTCKLAIGSLTHEEDKIRILEANLVLSNEANVNREWQLTSTTSSIASDKMAPYSDVYSRALFTFVLKRRPESFAATVILPAVVLMLVTLVTYWMETSESDRLLLAAADVLCHFLFLMHLGRALPSNGDKIPLIVTFYRDSMFLATVAVFAAAIVRGLRTLSVVLPIWASSLSNWVVQTRFGQVMIFHNPKYMVNTSTSRNGDTAVNNASLSDWDAFISLIDLLFFFVTFFTYIILLLGFIP